MKRAVLFDIGGVFVLDLWEHMFLNPVNGLAQLYSLDPAQLHQVGQTLWEEFELIPASDPTTVEVLEREYWNRVLAALPDLGRQTTVADLIADTEEYIVPIDLAAMEDLLQWLLGRGITLGICSDNCAFWFPRQRQKLELDRFFDPERVVLSQNIGAIKRDQEPVIYRAAIQAVGLEPAECLFVDNNIVNVEGANACGMTGILFPSGYAGGFLYLRRLFHKMGL